MLTARNILVHYDGRFDEHPGLECAIELAKANDATLKIVEMIPDFPWITRQLLGGYERVIESLTQTKTHQLAEIADAVRRDGIDVTTKVLDGKTSLAMIREVLSDDHDLVIKDAKGKLSPRSGFFGTTAKRLFRKCPCPVLVIKPGHKCDCEHVVAAISSVGEDEVHKKLNTRIVESAIDAANNGTPNIVTAWSVYGESILRSHMREDEFDELRGRTLREAEAITDNLLAPFGLGVEDPHVHVLEGEAGSIIPDFVTANNGDLLVMGSVGRSGFAGVLMGNTAEQILDCVECSVLAIKPAGFVSPIKG